MQAINTTIEQHPLQVDFRAQSNESIHFHILVNTLLQLFACTIPILSFHCHTCNVRVVILPSPPVQVWSPSLSVMYCQQCNDALIGLIRQFKHDMLIYAIYLCYAWYGWLEYGWHAWYVNLRMIRMIRMIRFLRMILDFRLHSLRVWKSCYACLRIWENSYT